jgi:transmembrane sensor
MKSSLSPSSSSAEETAALWAARLDGSELSSADRAQLNAWLQADPSHRVILSSYCQFSADLEQPLTALVESGVLTLPPADVATKPSRWKWFAGSLLMAAAAAVVFAIWIAQPVTQVSGVSTAVAHRQSLTLADGTHVDLNADTRLEVALSRAERRVRLLSGEAYFAVHKDPSRPFVIETPAGSVRVTGTTFDVRSDDAAHLNVLVVEGSVQVRPGDNGTLTLPPVLLGAGDALTSSPAGVSVKSLPAPVLEDALAWRRGEIVFAGVPLREALAHFSRYHGWPITAADSCSELPLGGRFSLDDPKGFFAALEELFPVRVEHEPSGAIRVVSRVAR